MKLKELIKKLEYPSIKITSIYNGEKNKLEWHCSIDDTVVTDLSIFPWGFGDTPDEALLALLKNLSGDIVCVRTKQIKKVIEARISKSLTL